MSSFFKTTGGVVTAIVVSLILLVGGFFAVNEFMLKTSDYRGNVGVHNQINANPNYIIPAYDSFHDQCNDVISDKETIQITLDSIGSKGISSTQRQFLQGALVAQRAKLVRDVNQYNSDSSKSYTKGQFRSSDLPFKLYIEGNTTCD